MEKREWRCELERTAESASRLVSFLELFLVGSQSDGQT